MIKKLYLKNFQIYEELTIEFDKHFNVILGPNDRGKSSIIRAIHWLFYNSPSGDWMRRIDENGKILTATVKIWDDEGNIFKRIKGEGINKYCVNEEVFENFGFAVPERIQEVLKIKKFTTNKSEFSLHVAMQDDKPFLTTESSTVKASVLDVLTGMSLVQKAITEFNKDKLNESRQLTFVESQLIDLNKQFDSLKDVENVGDKIKDCEKLEKSIDKNNDRLTEAKAIKNVYIKKCDTIGLCCKIIEVEETVHSAEQIYDNLKSLRLKIETLKKIKKLYSKCSEIKVPEIDMDKISKLESNLKSNKERLEKLIDTKMIYSKQELAITMNNKRFNESTNELKEVMKTYKVCPLLGIKCAELEKANG